MKNITDHLHYCVCAGTLVHGAANFEKAFAWLSLHNLGEGVGAESMCIHKKNTCIELHVSPTNLI